MTIKEVMSWHGTRAEASPIELRDPDYLTYYVVHAPFLLHFQDIDKPCLTFQLIATESAERVDLHFVHAKPGSR